MTLQRTLIIVGCVLGFVHVARGQEPATTYLPPPIVEEVPPPNWYFSLDLSLLQPRLWGNADTLAGFTDRLEWTVSPKFELGLVQQGPWNPYLGYRAVYSDRGQQMYEPFSDTTVTLARSTELHAIDLGIKNEVFPLLSIFQAQWDLSARLSILDFQDTFDLDFAGMGFINGRARQQFVGAGPRGGIKVALPFRDTGWSLTGQADAGLQWGGYRVKWQVFTSDGETVEEEVDHSSKGGVLWHAGGQLALQYAWPVCNPRVLYSMGYQYEAWFSKELGFLNGAERGRFDYQGPFVRFEWRF